MKKRFGKDFMLRSRSLKAGFKGIIVVGSLLFANAIHAQDTSLRVQYGFNGKTNTDSIIDETGHGYNARLIGSAQLKKLGKFSLMQIGSTIGYADMGTKIGEVISSLSNFTISTYLYIDPSLVLTNNGNFVWSFSNSADINTTATGCMFYSAKQSRYAICPTNWSTEKSVSYGTAATKGEWTHVTYTQSGSTGTVYIDGVPQKTGTVTMLPSALGATPFNYLGKSAYASDQYLLNSMYNDFRIYNRALSATEVAGLASNIATLDTLTFTQQAQVAAAAISLGDVNSVTSDITLPLSDSNGSTIQWSSSNTAVISNSGTVTRPASGADTATVQLTATVSRSFINVTRTFIVKVVPYYSNQTSVQMDADSLRLTGNLTNLHSNLTLPASGSQGSTITWTSDKPTVLSNAGAIVNRPAHGSGNATVILTATITKGGASIQKLFTISVAEDEGFAAYLFAFFTGNSISQENIRFATSNDGFIYKALNNNNPVVAADTVATTSYGLRDPHILRGENNDYYMVATDMRSSLGWSSNRAMVLMKSKDLINWTHVDLNIPQLYSQYAAADRVWAPQTIFDPKVGKYMIYFAMRLGSSDFDKIYYAYANSTFTALESAPQLLFNNNGLSTIDADIVYKDGQYHMFFKTEGNGNGIKRAVSNTLTGGYVLYDKYLQSTTNAVEGGCVYRMYNTDDWILIYDMYTSGAYQFTVSKDLINFSVVPNTVSFDFTPRHGTIIPI
ncbi:MAG: LamG-like jellyroll fold domain-containing protein, partial [Bacteroidota bacterium]|nr:LamG-like jellyroll fold domain-containing protein [Bacteroidota bacterium]